MTRPQLFNAVLEKAIAQLKHNWVERGWGIKVGPRKDDQLLNLRFADDLLLTSKSLSVLKKMMEELRQAVREVGLEFHTGKTKILSNAQGRKQSHATTVDIGGDQVEILTPTESTAYLCRALAFNDYHDREINHRIAAGWAKFTRYKGELCDRKIPLERRFKLLTPWSRRRCSTAVVVGQ